MRKKKIQTSTKNGLRSERKLKMLIGLPILLDLATASSKLIRFGWGSYKIKSNEFLEMTKTLIRWAWTVAIVIM